MGQCGEKGFFTKNFMLFPLIAALDVTDQPASPQESVGVFLNFLTLLRP